MPVRSIKVKLIAPKGNEGLPARRALWTTHAAVNDACAYYEQRLLLMRGASYGVPDETSDGGEKPAGREIPESEVIAERDRMIKAAIGKNGGKADGAAVEDAARLLRNLYENIVPSSIGKKGTAQNAGNYLDILVSPGSKAFKTHEEMQSLPVPEWAENRDSPDLDAADAWLASPDSALWMRQKKAGWIKTAGETDLEKRGQWPKQFISYLKRLQKNDAPGIVAQLRGLHALPLFEPHLTNQIDGAGKSLSRWDRLTFQLAAGHLLGWETQRRNTEEAHEERRTQLRNFRELHIDTEAAQPCIKKLRAYEAARSKTSQNPGTKEADYKIRASGIRGWHDLKKEWLSKPGKSEESLGKIIKTRQTRLRGKFGDPALFTWLAKPENHDLWESKSGFDPVHDTATLNRMEKIVERSKSTANMTLPDALLHPRAAQWEPKGGTHFRHYTLTAAEGRLSAELELLAPAPEGGFTEQEFGFKIAPSGQLRGVELEKSKTKIRVTYPDPGGGGNLSGACGNADLLFKRRFLESRREEQTEAGETGPVYLKLAVAVDQKLPEGWTGEPPPAMWHFMTAPGKKTKWEDKVAPGVRVLSVDLGVRTFASCAVFELCETAASKSLSFPVEIGGRVLHAVHERSFRLTLPGENSDSHTKKWRDERGDEFWRLHRVLVRYRSIMRMTGDEAADRPEALYSLEGVLGKENNPFDFELAALGALEGAKTAPQPVWDQAVADALKNYRKNLGQEIRDWRAKNRKRQEKDEERRHMGKSMWAIEHLTNTRKLLLSWSLLGRVTGDVRRQDRAKRGVFASRLLDHINNIKEDRLKTGADLIVQAARGYVRDKAGKWIQKHPPCEIVLFEDLSRYRMRTDRPRRENSQLMQWAHRDVRKETEMQGDLYGLHTADTSAAFSSRFHARLNTPGLRCRVLTKTNLQKDFIRETLKKDGFSPAALRPGHTVPWEGGEMFACVDGKSGAAVIHADINAAQNLQRRFWTRHAEAFRVSCRLAREGGREYWVPRSLGKRLAGAMGGPFVLVPAENGAENGTKNGLCRPEPVSPARFKKLGGGGEYADGGADSAADDMEALAEEALELSGEYKTFFRDPSGCVLAADLWCPSAEFWGRVKDVTLKALQTSGLAPPRAAQSPKGG